MMPSVQISCNAAFIPQKSDAIIVQSDILSAAKTPSGSGTMTMLFLLLHFFIVP